MESPNTSPQAVELKPSCSGQAHANRPGTGLGHKSTEPGSTFTVLRFPFVICPFRGADAKSGKVVQRDSAHLAQTGVWILVSLGNYLRTHLTDHARYDRVQRSTVSQGECRSHSAKLSWLDA